MDTPVDRILYLQRTAGNQAVSRLMRSGALQAKLRIGQPGDVYEQEGDRVADAVMRMPEQGVQRQVEPEEEEEEMLQSKLLANQITPLVQVQRQEEPEEEEEMLPAKPLAEEITPLVQRQVEPEEEEEEILQAESREDATSEVTNDLESQINAIRGGGRSLAESERAYFEPRFGVDFSRVRVHTDSRAKEAARAVHARAFTMGRNVVFGEGQYAPMTNIGQRLLAHELVHTIQQGKSYSEIPGKLASESRLTITKNSLLQVLRQSLLTVARENAAIRYNNRRYDERSIRIIQVITGTHVDGIFGRLSAEAVAAFQDGHGLGIDGMVGPDTLDEMVPNRAAVARHEHAIQLVVDFYNIDITSETLSVHYDPTIAAAGTTAFESGNLRVIRIGPTAFASSATLRASITAQLAVPAPAVAPVGPRPALLTITDELRAIRYNRRRFSDARSVRAIQGHVGTDPDGIWGPDTVQRVAQAQDNGRIGIDGMVGPQTLQLFTTQLIATGQQNAAIRMIVDFYNFRDDGNLLTVYYDPTVAAAASTDYRPDEPVRVRVGPTGLAQPFAGIVHTIAHEYEHVRRLREGIVPAATHEFLGEAIEILSVGMPEEDLESLPPGAPGYVPGFANDAQRALANWNNMLLADRMRFRARFIAVRNMVQNRIVAGTPAQQALHAGLLAAYNAVVLPPP
jgi:peptidoglycan hydrolase-like protein with peptidoglycan-binding domain